MPADFVFEMPLEDLLSSSAVEKLEKAMDTIAAIQEKLTALFANGDGASLNLLRIGTVFQIFLIDTLASGKKAKELTKDDWISIAEKVSQYAICEDGQAYTEFVFTLYADYIHVSVESLKSVANEESLKEITKREEEIHSKTELLRNGELKETNYVEDCLWLSLEAMIKLFSASLSKLIGPEFTQLAEAVSQLAFEFGRYVLYAKEQAILAAYIQNQHVLDEQLQREYDEYLAEVQENAERFQSLVDNAFSTDLHDALLQTAALAREAGVSEDELLTTKEEVDAFFLD